MIEKEKKVTKNVTEKLHLILNKRESEQCGIRGGTRVEVTYDYENEIIYIKAIK